MLDSDYLVTKVIEGLKERDYQYRYNGVLFILICLNELVSLSHEDGTTPSTKDFVEEFPCMLVEELGPMSELALKQWGITTWEDLGKVVFLWVELKGISASDEDSMTHFLEAPGSLLTTVRTFINGVYYPKLFDRIGVESVEDN